MEVGEMLGRVRTEDQRLVDVGVLEQSHDQIQDLQLVELLAIGQSCEMRCQNLPAGRGPGGEITGRLPKPSLRRRSIDSAIVAGG